MDTTYRKPYTVLPSVCDREGLLSIADTFAAFMDVATLHAEQLGVGMRMMMQKGLFWLTVKTRVRFVRRPRLLEQVTLVTRPLAPDRLRSVREYAVEKDGETLILGKTEWAVFETAAGKLHAIPELFTGLELPTDPLFSEPFSRIPPDFSEARELGRYTVRRTDVDLAGHMNNIAYLRAFLGLIPSDAWGDFPKGMLEICFRTPCFEGSTLTFRVRETETGCELAGFLPDGRCPVLIRADR